MHDILYYQNYMLYVWNSIDMNLNVNWRARIMKIRLSSCVQLLAAILLLAPGCGDVNATAGEVLIDGVTLQWNTDASEIEVTVSAPTTGWIALGIEPLAVMKDADIIIGYVSDGEVFLRDDWGDGYTSHKSDEELGGTDDITLVSGSEEDGITEISFTRLLAADDVYDRELETGITYNILLAYGRDDADNFQGHHAWAGSVSIEI